MLLAALSASAAVTFDASSNSGTTSNTGNTTVSFSHTLGTGSNRLVVCEVAIANSTAQANVHPVITFGGATMTEITGSLGSGSPFGSGTSKIESELFYINDTGLGSMSGSLQVVVTLTTGPATGGTIAGCTSHRRDEARGDQRMATEIEEEIGVELDRLARHQRLHRRQQHSLGLVGRLFVRLGWRSRQVQRHLCQGFAVELARGQGREFLDGLEMGRDHVRRHGRRQGPAPGFGIDSGIGRQFDEGDQMIHLAIAAQHQGGLQHAGLFAEAGLDLAQFDAEAADLDLVVDAALENQAAFGILDHRIAGAVEHGIGAIDAERIGDEFLRGQLVAAPVTLGPRPGRRSTARLRHPASRCAGCHRPHRSCSRAARGRW